MEKVIGYVVFDNNGELFVSCGGNGFYANEYKARCAVLNAQDQAAMKHGSDSKSIPAYTIKPVFVKE